MKSKITNGHTIQYVSLILLFFISISYSFASDRAFDESFLDKHDEREFDFEKTEKINSTTTDFVERYSYTNMSSGFLEHLPVELYQETPSDATLFDNIFEKIEGNRQISVYKFYIGI